MRSTFGLDMPRVPALRRTPEAFPYTSLRDAVDPKSRTSAGTGTSRKEIWGKSVREYWLATMRVG
jgi:hypothetical protein